ncbi:uncharacterized protein LOC143017989 [Oratosquilla oratoria]|uniref:uncharacterized protein LOC143017989 n=1 Tax=Oratosquilla oratoria TaxID=337810 RepID=UPI003F77517D
MSTSKGIPRQIQSDQETNFTSSLFNQVLTELGIEHVTSSAYHPQSQGCVERYHQSLKAMLRKYCLDTGSSWDSNLDWIIFSIREANHEAMGFSPFELLYGRSLRGPLTLFKEQWFKSNQEKTNVNSYIQNLINKLQEVRAVSKAHFSQFQKRSKLEYDRTSKVRTFKVGDMVRKKQQLVHINLIKRYLSRPPEEDTKTMPISIVNPVTLPKDEGAPTTDFPLPNSAFSNRETLHHLDKVMAFGLTNAPATFQRLINAVIQGLPGVGAYLDDVVVVADNWEDHLTRLDGLFHRLKEAGLVINLQKSVFARGTVTYLGHTVGGGSVRPKKTNVEAILAFPTPRTRKEVMRFLGMAGYYRRFCKNFSTVAAPLTDLTSSAKSFQWSPSCQTSFENIKSFLTSEPVLKTPNYHLPFHLQIDASGVGVGAVLLQPDPTSTILHPVAFFSTKLNKHQ